MTTIFLTIKYNELINIFSLIDNLFENSYIKDKISIYVYESTNDTMLNIDFFINNKDLVEDCFFDFFTQNEKYYTIQLSSKKENVNFLLEINIFLTYFFVLNFNMHIWSEISNGINSEILFINFGSNKILNNLKITNDNKFINNFF